MGSTWHSEVGGNGSKEVLRNLFSLWCHKLAICLCKHTHSEEVFSELYGTVNYLYRRSSHKWVKRLLKVSSKLHSDRENTMFPFPEVLIQPYDIKHRYNNSQEKATYGLQKTRVASSPVLFLASNPSRMDLIKGVCTCYSNVRSGVRAFRGIEILLSVSFKRQLKYRVSSNLWG